MEYPHFQLEIHLQGVNCPFAMLVYQSATTLPQHSASRSCCGAACDGCRVSVALAFPKGCFRFAEKIGLQHWHQTVQTSEKSHPIALPEAQFQKNFWSFCRKKPFPCCENLLRLRLPLLRSLERRSGVRRRSRPWPLWTMSWLVNLQPSNVPSPKIRSY